MRIELLALYGGPDQVMTVTSGLASVLGLLLTVLEQGSWTFLQGRTEISPLRDAFSP